MTTAKKFFLRCGLVAWIEQMSPRDTRPPWRFIGHVVRPGGKREGPHLWTWVGDWREDGRPDDFDLDIERSYPLHAPAKTAGPK